MILLPSLSHAMNSKKIRQPFSPPLPFVWTKNQQDHLPPLSPPFPLKMADLHWNSSTNSRSPSPLLVPEIMRPRTTTISRLLLLKNSRQQPYFSVDFDAFFQRKTAAKKYISSPQIRFRYITSFLLNLCIFFRLTKATNRSKSLFI